MKSLSPFARRALLFSMLGAAVPAALVAGGCGGGSSGLPISTNYKLAATLDYSAVSQNSNAFTVRIENFDTSSSTFSGVLLNRGGQQNATFSGVNRIVNTVTERRLYVQLASPSGSKFAVGQEIPLKLGTQSNILLRQNNTDNSTGGDRIWNSDGGTATVTAIGSDSISLRLNNALFVPSSAFLGQGTFLLNGPLSATGLGVTNG